MFFQNNSTDFYAMGEDDLEALATSADADPQSLNLTAKDTSASPIAVASAQDAPIMQSIEGADGADDDNQSDDTRSLTDSIRQHIVEEDFATTPTTTGSTPSPTTRRSSFEMISSTT